MALVGWWYMNDHFFANNVAFSPPTQLSCMPVHAHRPDGIIIELVGASYFKHCHIKSFFIWKIFFQENSNYETMLFVKSWLGQILTVPICSDGPVSPHALQGPTPLLRLPSFVPLHSIYFFDRSNAEWNVDLYLKKSKDRIETLPVWGTTMTATGFHI